MNPCPKEQHHLACPDAISNLFYQVNYLPLSMSDRPEVGPRGSRANLLRALHPVSAQDLVGHRRALNTLE